MVCWPCGLLAVRLFGCVVVFPCALFWPSVVCGRFVISEPREILLVVIIVVLSSFPFGYDLLFKRFLVVLVWPGFWLGLCAGAVCCVV